MTVSCLRNYSGFKLLVQLYALWFLFVKDGTSSEVAYRGTVAWNMLSSKYTDLADTSHCNLEKRSKLQIFLRPLN